MSSRFSTPATLRTRPSEPMAPVQREVRRCKECGGPVAELHGGDTCFRCEEKQIEERNERFLASPEGQRAKAEMERARQLKERRADEYGVIQRTRPRGSGVIEVNGCKLVPATLPKMGWAAVVEAFVASGHECVVVESSKSAKSLYASLKAASKGTGAKPVAADGKCYLVRAA